MFVMAATTIEIGRASTDWQSPQESQTDHSEAAA